MLIITSKDNQYLKLLRAVGQRKGREQAGCYLIEGLRVAEEALAAGLPLRQALFRQDVLAQPRAAALAAALEAAGCPVAAVEGELLDKALATEHPQGVALLAEIGSEKPLLPQAGGCFACLDRLADPGNLGTIARSAQAAGVSGLLLSGDCADPYNPKAVRSAMGALFKLPLARFAQEQQAYAALRDLNVTILAAAADGEDVREVDLTGSHCWVLGSEAQGVSPFWRSQADHVVSLPMAANAESLNVAAAAVVLFYQSLFAREGK